MPVVAIKPILREKLTDEGTEALIELINVTKDETKKDVIEIVEEKFEGMLTEEISQLRAVDLVKLDKRITEEVAKLNKRITEEISKLDIKLSKEIADTRADIIKWMFIFWAGQIFAMLGILFAFFRK